MNKIYETRVRKTEIIRQRRTVIPERGAPQEVSLRAAQRTALRAFPGCGAGRGPKGICQTPRIMQRVLRVRGDQGGQSLQVGPPERREL